MIAFLKTNECAMVESNQSNKKVLEDNWYEKEFGTINIGDKRLNKRAIKIAGDLSNQLSAPINQASEDWSATKAAYNFFDNDKVKPDKIYAPHIENTITRMKSHETVLAIQDTTSFNYGSHEAVKGLGHIGKEGTRGFMQHNTLVVTTNGLPLGLIDQLVWTRPEIIEEKKQNKLISIEEKESYKWLRSLKKTIGRVPASTKVITVCDREADIYEFFDEAEKNNAKLLVRLKVNRKIENSNKPIKTFLQSQEAIAEYEFEVPKKKGQYPSRLAKVEIRHAPLMINAPEHLKDSVSNTEIEMHGIYIKEVNAPDGVKPIEWYLLTNDAIENTEDVLEKIKWYKTRWMVEIYHKVQKSCCNVEDCRLETIDRLTRFIALESILAWRVLWVTYCNRVEPDAPAETILSLTEIQILQARNDKYTKGFKTKPPRIKKVKHAILAIASLGGHLGRLKDDEPGIIAVSRGLQSLYLLLEGVEIWSGIKSYG